MDNDTALKALINLTNANFGYPPTTPTEFNKLCRSIESRTGRSISLSSIKRIWGYVNYSGFPSVTTLNNLAQFNGYADWSSFLKDDSNEADESGFLEGSSINLEQLHIGDRLILKWAGKKSCHIKCIGPLRFSVLESSNIKLQPNDAFTLRSLLKSHPLFVTNIQRGDTLLPAYVGAKKGGILSIEYFPA